MQVAAANTPIVKALMEHLVKAFEDFADQQAEKDPEGLQFIDGLMGCHNFYKAVILDLEGRTNAPKRFIRRVAVDTLISGLKLGGHYQTLSEPIPTKGD